MANFIGFSEGPETFTPIPETFFRELLPQIDHYGELKLTLYIIWLLAKKEGKFRYLSRGELTSDQALVELLNAAGTSLDETIQLSLERGVILEARLDKNDVTFYFLNSPKGRAAIEAIHNGNWNPIDEPDFLTTIAIEPPNIYRLYEENIGPITPMIADALKEAEENYPIQWIEDAIRIAVEKNKRNWRYAEAILERWHREGHDVRKETTKDRRNAEEDSRRYVEGRFSDFIEH